MDWMKIAQIIISVILVTVILLQNKGAGVSGVFGGGGNVYSTKRGLDKILFKLTIVFASVFFVVSLLSVVL